MVGFEGPFNGHAAVVSGYFPGNPATYLLNDPYFDQLRVTYDALLSGPMTGGPATPWVETWVHMAPNTQGCNYAFNPKCCH
jgi:hypothetical protein